MSSDANKTNDPDKSKLRWFAEKILIPLLVALIAGYVSLVAAKVLPNPYPTSTSLSPTPESFELAGIWEGANPSGVLFRFTFGSKCNLGDVCGKVELPTVGCTAFPVLVSTDGETYIFQETNNQNCGSVTGNDTLKILADGTLLFRSNGQAPTIILYRK